MLVERKYYLQKIEKLFRSHKAVALLGARQCGKTTLSRLYARSYPNQEHIHVFDLENSVDLETLQNPMTVLKQLTGLIIIDEIQRRPEIFPILRVLLDDESLKQRYLLLGSASRDLIKQSSETLAGRIAYEEVDPFSLAEVDDREKLFLRGGFPNSYLADDDEESNDWRENYIRTYLERDIPALGINIPAITMRRFWMMLTHYNSGIFNASDIAISMGVSDKTIKNYLDILVGTFMIRQLPPWFANIKKRQVKRPKIYFRDSGILHHLLGLESFNELLNYPRLGLSWESFAMEQIINMNKYPNENCFFWAVHEQAELDLLVFHKGQSIGYEFKYVDAPKLTTSMINSLDTLNLHKLFVIYPGDKAYSLSEKVEVTPLKAV
jgi:hypothetical protein